MWMPIVVMLIWRNRLTIWAPYLERLIQNPHVTAVLTPEASSKQQLPICCTFSESFASIKYMPVQQRFSHSDVFHRWNSPASSCAKHARRGSLSIADEYLSVTMWRKKSIKFITAVGIYHSLIPLLSAGGADGVEKATAGRVVRWHFDSGYDIKNEVCVSDEFSFPHDPELISANN